MSEYIEIHFDNLIKQKALENIFLLEEIKNSIMDVLSNDQIEFSAIRASIESDRLIFQVKFSKYPSNWTISDFKYLLNQIQDFKISKVIWNS